MNTTKNCFFALAFVAVALTAPTPSARATPTWAENYGCGSFDQNGHPSQDPFYGSGIDYPRGIAPIPDGGFVVAGQIAFPFLTINTGYGGASDAVLMRLAADGTILWQKELRQTNDSSFNGVYTPAPSYIAQVRTDAQGNIFVAGGKGNPGNNGQVPFVAKFSPAGELLWQNGIPLAGGTVPGTPPQPYEVGVTGSSLQMGLTNDGGVVITASQSRPAGYSIPILARFDANGAVSLYRAYENPDQYAPNGPVAQSADGSKYVTLVGHLDANQTTYSIYLFVISASDGSVLAQRSWPSLDGGRETPVALIRTADGGFASLSIKDDSAGIIFRRFNADASETTVARLITPVSGVSRFWVGSFSQPADTGSFSQTSDGKFLIGGHSSNGSAAEDAAVMKLSENGTVEFVSLIGGQRNEGGYQYGASGAVVTPLSDGGYGIAIDSATYVTQPAGEDFRQKKDWWLVKADANRKVRNFTGNMVDLDPGAFIASASSPAVGSAISYLTTPSYSANPLPSAAPAFSLMDLNTRTSIDLPSLTIQASSPRIVSSSRAEAIVQQHFSYHIATAFFPETNAVSYNASGLPQGFTINSATGVISGVPAAGTETTTPIAISLSASDGVDTAQTTLQLTIGDGLPAFTVNESEQPAYPTPGGTPVPGLADHVLRFSAQYPGQQPGRIMNVEATTTPENAASWQRLANGTNGYMVLDGSSARYVLNSTSYPQQNAVYFRAKASVTGRPEVISNVVGPFDLASGTARAGQPVFSIIRNGIRADLDFRAVELSGPAGVALKVQTSRTPAAEGSWTDLPDSGAGAMIPEGGNLYAHTANNLPAAAGVYFRALAQASGAINSLSNIIGPFALTSDNPPVVMVHRPAGGSGAGTQDDPVVFTTDANGQLTLTLSGSAMSNRALQSLSILVDGSPVQTVSGPATVSLDYTTTRIGDRVIEILATDDLGATARAGTGPLYIRINPAVPTSAPTKAVAAQVSGHAYSLTRDGAVWTDATAWSDAFGAHGVPGANDVALIGNLSVRFTLDVEVGALSMIGSGARLTGPGILTVRNKITLYAGAATGFMQLVLKEGGLCEMLNEADFAFDGAITNHGTWRMRGRGGLVGLESFRSTGISDFHMPLLNPVAVAAGLPATPRVLSAASVLNSGQLAVNGIISTNGGGIVAQGGGNIVAQGGGNIVAQGGGNLVAPNGGTIVAQGGGNIISTNGGGIVAQGGGNIVAQGGGNFVQQGSLLIGNDGAGIVAQGGGNIVAQGGGNIVAQGGGNRPTRDGSTSSGFVQTAGETNLDYIMITGAVKVQGGVLHGSGLIAGDLSLDGGFIAPGNSAGLIAVTGNYAQSASSTLALEVAGGEANAFDQVVVGGGASLAGTLTVTTSNGYNAVPNDTFAPVGAAALSGGFASSSTNVQLMTTPNGVLATLNPAAPNPPPARLVNISTRALVEAGDNVLIGGFIVAGPGSKRVIIRAIGPSLPVAGALPDTVLELHEADGTVITNDDWRSTQEAEIIASTVPPTSNLESAIVATLPPGAHTAIVKGKGAATGVALVEVYDLDLGGTAALVNISTRCRVNTGDNVMIGGFIVQGTAPAKVLVRAIGPSLGQRGVAGALADPLLELHDRNGNAIGNDDWRETQEAAIIATTVPPESNKEAAIVSTLAPDAYTAIVRGKNESIGVALVEVYRLP